MFAASALPYGFWRGPARSACCEANSGRPYPFETGRLYADKTYIDAAWAALKKNHALELITPRKKHKEDPLASGDTFSTFVSSVRQPVECFFNWLNRLTAIQTVCSLSGLLLHLFARIAAALISLVFYP